MKSAIIVASLLTSLVLAGPVKRAVVTEYEFKTVTVTKVAHKGNPAAPSQTTQTTQESLSIIPIETTTSTVATETSSSAPAPNPSNVVDKNLPDYAQKILEQHNLHRLNHSAPLLAWNDTLVASAKQIAETCVYEHSKIGGDGNYGQNIGAGAPDSDIPKMITNQMYNNEMEAYPGYGQEPSMDNFHVWGHFSQIVWVNTKSVGCYTKRCSSLAKVGKNVQPYFTVCNYFPPGNFGKQYAKNVLKPLGQSMVTI